uniref:Uncharacterized protein n=1 Tax=Globisporangium ultimum (strain ATCC 200006 / CBS 805.95 / DAOM BR144) TaxID=431595 RepID=K3WN82_GLOUD
MRTLRSVAALALVVAPLTRADTDIPAQLRDYKDSVTAPPTPSRLSAALTSFLKGTNLTSLSPTLQRALLWDAGYVRTNSQEDNSYVNVFVLCGHTMSDTFLGLDSINRTACPLDVCKQFSYNLATSDCDAASIAAQTRCAVADDISITATTMPVWAQEGDIDGSFDAQMYQETYSDSGTNSTLYLITEGTEIDSKCASAPRFVIPCRKVASTDVTFTKQEKKWCPPTISLGVSLWFESETAASLSSSSNDMAGGSTTSENGSSNSSNHTAALVLGIALGLALVACAVLFYLYRKSKQDTSKPPPTPGYAPLDNGQRNATTDIPAQLHMLGALVTEAPPTPSKLSTSLKSLVGDTSKLAARTPALQRALLWDAGQMWAGTADTYIDTYVLCGHSMNDVFLGLDAFDTGKCPLKPCKQFSFNLALSTCDASTVESETLCAVVAEDVVTTKLSAFGGPVWAQEGVISSAFVPQIYQNDVKSSNGTTTMFLISQNGDFKGTKDACGSSPSFVIPCRKVSRSEVTESAQERKWCHPTSQLGVQLWYQAETRTASGFSGGSSDSAISSTVDGGNTANAGSTDSSNGSSSTTTIILGAALGVAVIISGVLLFQICKRKDHSKSL